MSKFGQVFDLVVKTDVRVCGSNKLIVNQFIKFYQLPRAEDIFAVFLQRFMIAFSKIVITDGTVRYTL